jgi:hypothetical protein
LQGIFAWLFTNTLQQSIFTEHFSNAFKQIILADHFGNTLLAEHFSRALWKNISAIHS